jgi:putative DNA primase/helicase
MMDFRQHCESHGLIIRDLIADGHWHRARTVDHPKKQNGVYVLNTTRGVCRNYAMEEGFSVWRAEQHRAIVGGFAARAIADSIKEEKRQERGRHADAAKKATKLLSGCEITTHPYLARKGFPQQTGFVSNGLLVIPMRDHQSYHVNSAQTISEAGEKKFLPGGKAKGSVFKIGPPKAQERWLCEGYATALSVLAALHDLRRTAEVWTCFSAGNLMYVAQSVRRPAFVFADNDKSCAGQHAAEDSQLPWCMSPTIGQDANDLHQAKGLRAVCKLIQAIEYPDDR